MHHLTIPGRWTIDGFPINRDILIVEATASGAVAVGTIIPSPPVPLSLDASGAIRGWGLSVAFLPDRAVDIDGLDLPAHRHA